MQAPVFLLFVAVINLGVCQECAEDWQQFQGNCYRYGGTTVSWGEAQAICQSQGARLAEIPTFKVNNFVLTLVKPKKDTCVWLGGYDIFNEGAWEWSSRRRDFNSFTNWHSGEPNNNNNDQDCLQMHNQYNYKWDDGSCNEKCNFICAAPVI
ncbi:hypothetical protein BsWGS_11928 [Bradybaena similaris]